jgi:hypothetical protein
VKHLRTLAVLLAIVPMAAALNACASGGQASSAAGDVSPDNVVGLDVRNQNFLDVNVYSMVDGMSTRLGTVTGNGSRHFTLNPMVGSQNFSLIAVPIGGFGQASTGSLAIAAGQTVMFTVGPVLEQSSVVIR